MLPTLLLPFALLATGCMGRHLIAGQVLDRNGRPLDRAVIAMEPGRVELITDAQGRFTVDYLRDAEGERVRLHRHADYVVEVLKPGYHAAKRKFYYRRGELVLEPILLVEDTVAVAPGEEDIDPARFPDRAHSDGSNYEGE